MILYPFAANPALPPKANPPAAKPTLMMYHHPHYNLGAAATRGDLFYAAAIFAKRHTHFTHIRKKLHSSNF